VVRAADDDFALDPGLVPDEADMVVLGRPDNPTGRLESLDTVAALTRPGRVVVLDEAFADFLPDADSLASQRLPGLVCVRSMTKLWGLAGLRVGYVLGPEERLSRMASALQPCPANALAVHAHARLLPNEQQRASRACRVSHA